LSIFILAGSNPLENKLYTAVCACIMVFFAATQDIIIDAYRIEILAKEPEKQGIGLTMFIYSYRVAMLAASAGGLLLSQYFSWFEVYALIALVIFIAAILIAIFAKEPLAIKNDFSARSIKEIFAQVIVAPFKDFSTKKNWLMILFFTITFKLGDAMLGAMDMPFFLNMGFDKPTIVKVSKLFGFWATMVGTLCGGVLVYRLGMMKSLWIGGILQMITNGLFALQAHIGYSVKLLALTVGADSFTSGLGSAVFIAYLSSICSVNFTATQYAILSSLAGLARTTIASPAGLIVEHVGWFWFAIVTMFAALPGFICLFVLSRSLAKK
jgi:PAT family beta-lactamase induction signal transducer AmpG